MAKMSAGGNHRGNGGAAQQTVELTSYEARRLQELDTTMQNLDQSRQALIEKLRQVDDFRREVAGRKAELMEMLADKYGIDSRGSYHLDENKLTVEVKDG